MRAVAIAIGILVGLGIAAWLIGVNAHRFVDTGAEHYGSSLSREVEDGVGGACGEIKEQGRWWCGVETDAGSGYSRSFILQPDGERCWTARAAHARRVRRDPPKDYVIVVTERGRELSGCVGLWDYLVPDNPAFGDGEDRPPGQMVLRRG